MKSATKYHLLNKDYDDKLSSDIDEPDDDEDETNSQSSCYFEKKRYDNWPTLHKTPSTIGDGDDIRRPVFNSLYKKPGLAAALLQEEAFDSSLEKKDKNWKLTSKRLTKAMLHADDEDEDTVETKSLSNKSQSLSIHSRTSLEPKTSELVNDVQLLSDNYGMLRKYSPDKTKQQMRASAASLINEHDINYVTLIGLTVGLLLSKTLQYLLVYFDWLLRQVVQLRVAVFGDCNFWGFMNVADNPRYSLRFKLLLMPLLAVGGVVYSLVIVLHYSLRLLLSQAPNFLVIMLQKICQDS